MVTIKKKIELDENNLFFSLVTDVSTYWVNYVSLKGLGVIVDLAQVAVLFTVTLRYLSCSNNQIVLNLLLLIPFFLNKKK